MSAAVLLGRCRRWVLVCDSGAYRNAVSRQMHAFPGRDGTDPAELRAAGRTEVIRYPSVRLEQVELADGRAVHARALLLAAGVVDELPPLPAVEQLYGRSVFHCPNCDGWEQRDQPIAVYGRGHDGLGLALELTAWSRDLVLCTDGPDGLDERGRDRLGRHGIVIELRRIVE
ncbi:MAG: NAD(P)/FAD-dependent oxidoreductase, partial [Actinobacteria bacterium]|nr:NAD(P)/FAD-dependent oxidoreductase [Actinomycetota bacterium]